MTTISRILRPDERLFAYCGRSMWPTFQDGDALVMRALRPSRSPCRGDCVVFSLLPGEPPAVHRVVAVLDGGRAFATRGDAHRHLDDEPVPRALVIGVVTARIRYGREARVHGGAAGRLSCAVLRLGGRLDPSRASRGGRAGRALRTLAHPVARRVILPRLRYEPRSDGVDGVLATLSERVVAASTGRESTLLTVWPWTLVMREVLAKNRPGGMGR